MNNNEVKNVENKQNNSLMRKTKVQLVEIILRKDSIEKNLRDDIANTKVELNKVKTKIDKYAIIVFSFSTLLMMVNSM